MGCVCVCLYVCLSVRGVSMHIYMYECTSVCIPCPTISRNFPIGQLRKHLSFSSRTVRLLPLQREGDYLVQMNNAAGISMA